MTNGYKSIVKLLNRHTLESLCVVICAMLDTIVANE